MDRPRQIENEHKCLGLTPQQCLSNGLSYYFLNRPMLYDFTITKARMTPGLVYDLLEDLQSTVPTKPMMNSSVTGNRGYRETFKSASYQKDGNAPQTSKEYEIQHFNPSKPTSTIFADRPKSPFINRDSSNGTPGKNYKTVSYEYSKNKQSGSHSGTPIVDSKFERHSDRTSSFEKNIDKFDSLMKKEYCSSDSNKATRFEEHDSAFSKTSSLPRSSQHVSKLEKSFEEKRFNNSSPITRSEVKKEVYVNGEPVEKFYDKYSSDGSHSVKKDLSSFSGGNDFKEHTISNFTEPCPAAGKIEKVYQYESKTSSTKKSRQVPSPTTFYSFESDVTDSAMPYRRSPSPVRTVQNYSSTVKESSARRSPSPVQYYTSTSSVTHNVTPQPVRRALYQANKTVKETKTTRRSPSPVTFTPVPEPPVETSLSSYNSERKVTNSPVRETIPGHTIITRNYKYSSQSTQNTRTIEEPAPYVRPYTPPQPKPEIREQEPPEQLEELMASFSDSESCYRETYKYQTRTPPATPPKAPEKIHTIETEAKLNECKKTNGVAGPAVYYPPGPLFTKKSEQLVASDKGVNGKGKYKAHRQANYKYEAGSEIKDKSDTKKTIVPLCAPLCCALPCVIM